MRNRHFEFSDFESLQKLLEDTGAFTRTVKDIDDLTSLIANFYSLKYSVIPFILNDRNQYERLIQTSRDFVTMVKHFPDYAGPLIQRILTDKNEFKRLVKDGWDYYWILYSLWRDEEFQPHAETFIKPVLTNNEDYQLIIDSAESLDKIAEYYPHHAEIFIQRILCDANEFKRLIKNCFDLSDIIQRFPHHKETILQRILKNPEEFKRVVIDTNESDRFYVYPAGAGIFNTLLGLPHGATFVQRWLNYPGTLEKFIPDVKTLTLFMSGYRRVAKFFVRALINQPDQLNRLIKTDEREQRLYKLFPNYRRPILRILNGPRTLDGISPANSSSSFFKSGNPTKPLPMEKIHISDEQMARSVFARPPRSK